MRSLILSLIATSSALAGGDCNPPDCNMSSVVASLTIVNMNTGELGPEYVYEGDLIGMIVHVGTNEPPKPNGIFIACDVMASHTTVHWPDGTEEEIDTGPYGFGEDGGLGEVIFSAETSWVACRDDLKQGDCVALFWLDHHALQCDENSSHAAPTWTLTTVIKSDVDNNDVVDLGDVLGVILNWDDPPGAAGDIEPDTNCDGQVDADDLLNVVLKWGQERCGEEPEGLLEFPFRITHHVVVGADG